MTPKQILDSFSETLMQDDRILSVQERALLTSLLQHARNSAADDPQTREAVRTVIAAAIGETVAQRAFAVLGQSIVERILNPGVTAAEQLPKTTNDAPGKQPQPPNVTPPPPKKAPPKPSPVRDVPVEPPKQPQPPNASLRPLDEPTRVRTLQQAETALADRPLHLPAQCVILDEFLAPQELEELTRFVLDHEADFQTSEVLSSKAEQGVVNYEHRRSMVLMDLGRFQDQMLARIKTVLPEVLPQLGMEEFAIRGVETQVTASNDGDFFRFHNDNGSDAVESRHLTFVYFFHREPRHFAGGELRIHDSQLEGDHYVSEGTYQTIVPRQNQIVFFPCELMHEITPLECASRLFADSRFTLNGWLRQ